MAQTYNDLGENQQAINSYKDFIKNHPNNNFVSSAMVEIGGIYLKEKNYVEAEKYFTQVIAQYPDAEAENTLAVELMKEVYAGKNNLPGYYDWLTAQGIQISQNERDSTLWLPVQQARDAGDCDQQLIKGAEYLTNLDHPRHEISAHYFIGNCLYSAGQTTYAPAVPRTSARPSNSHPQTQRIGKIREKKTGSCSSVHLHWFRSCCHTK